MGFVPVVSNSVRRLPVILLLDVSGSMSYENRIDSLNTAVQEMIDSFKNNEQKEVNIALSVITFGGNATVQLPLSDVKDITFTRTFNAVGDTPLGAALKIAKSMVEDKELIRSKDYRPTIVLASDGGPNDEWEYVMNDFISNGRSSKCDRWALAIGESADEDMLKKFLKGTENQLLHACNANQLVNFFKLISMSINTRSKSQNPNMLPRLTQSTAMTGNLLDSNIALISSLFQIEAK